MIYLYDCYRNGIACRLQRLLNQRRSAARIWQYKRSKLSRLNGEDEAKVAQESQGRELTVMSVRTDHSHIVLYSKEEDKGKLIFFIRRDFLVPVTTALHFLQENSQTGKHSETRYWWFWILV